MVDGLIITKRLTQRNVRSIDLKFEPSVGIMARKVDKLGLDIRSFREPIKRSIQQVIIPSIRRNFDEGGRPAWEPLTDQTIARKGGDERPLIRTGALRRQMGYFKLWTVDQEKGLLADLPADVWYGKVHQAGASFSIKSRGPANLEAISKALNLTYSKRGSQGSSSSFGDSGEIPARPFVMIQPEDERDIHEVFEDWLGERIAAAGLGGSAI